MINHKNGQWIREPQDPSLGTVAVGFILLILVGGFLLWADNGFKMVNIDFVDYQSSSK